MWIRFSGFIRAMVGSDERFISSEPSPSRATIRRPGRPSAMPSAIDEQSPSVRTRKLPSPGRKEFHSKVIAPAELTMSASSMTGASAFRQSNRFMTFKATVSKSHPGSALLQGGSERGAAAKHFLGQQQRHRPFRILRQSLTAAYQFRGIAAVAHDVVADSQRLQHRFGLAAGGAEGAIADIA